MQKLSQKCAEVVKLDKGFPLISVENGPKVRAEFNNFLSKKRTAVAIGDRVRVSVPAEGDDPSIGIRDQGLGELGNRDQGLGNSSDSQSAAPTNPYSLVPNPLGITLTGDGILRGIFYCGRILLLGWSSLYVANTVSLIEFAAVFKWMFWPLRKLKVPVQDASLAVSIALRFIPEIFFEFQNIREAQWCRGAKMTSGGLVARTRAHAGCFVPLIVRMMANVDNLSDALTARCWGVYEVSPKEEMDQVSPVQVAFTAIVCILICSVAVLV